MFYTTRTEILKKNQSFVVEDKCIDRAVCIWSCTLRFNILGWSSETLSVSARAQAWWRYQMINRIQAIGDGSKEILICHLSKHSWVWHPIYHFLHVVVRALNHFGYNIKIGIFNLESFVIMKYISGFNVWDCERYPPSHSRLSWPSYHDKHLLPCLYTIFITIWHAYIWSWIWWYCCQAQAHSHTHSHMAS